MRALIFAAGRGERMRPLTDTLPKPLLMLRGKRLIEWHLIALAAAGVRYVVINTSYRAEAFPALLGDGSRYGVRIRYSYEGETPLETGGGMWRALPLLGRDPFIAVSADIHAAIDFAALPAAPRGDAHLVLVANPAHHPRGDFALADDGLVHLANAAPEGARTCTFSGVGVFRPEFLDRWERIVEEPGGNPAAPRFKLRPILDARIRAARVHGEFFQAPWSDVGTPERLAELDRATPQALADR